MSTTTLRDGTPLRLRSVAPSDAASLSELVRALPAQDRVWRFHGRLNGLTQRRLGEMVNPSPGSIVLVATVQGQLVADVRCIPDESGTSAEFALLVSHHWRRRGVGLLCVQTLLSVAQQREIRWIHGSVLADNEPMLSLMRKCGFLCVQDRRSDALMAVEKQVNPLRTNDGPDRLGAVSEALRSAARLLRDTTPGLFTGSCTDLRGTRR